HLGPGLPLPERTRTIGRPDYSAVMKFAGLHWYGAERDAEFKQAIDEVAVIVGIGTDGYRPAGVTASTYRDLIKSGSARYAHDYGADAVSSLRRFLSALRVFMKSQD